MKTSLFIIPFFIFYALESYSQDRSKEKAKVDIRKDDNCMLNGNFNTPLYFENHEKSGVKINHNSIDYIQFNQDGTYVEKINGVVCNGTWTYDYSSHTVTTSCQGKIAWSLSKPNENLLEMSVDNEKIKLLKKN